MQKKKLIGSNNESAILDIISQLTNLKEALQTNEKSGTRTNVIFKL